MPPVAMPEEGKGSVGSEDLVGPAVERMIVRRGTLQLIVADVPLTIDRIGSLAESLSGYVVSSNSWREGERLIGEITVRVPAEDFTMSMSVIREMAVEVMLESTSSQDVTEEYVDLGAKLKNLEATEEQLLRLMEKAEDVQDILAVQTELFRTREDIERTLGRMQYLERTSAMSLIDVRLQQSEVDVNFTVDSRKVERGEEIWFMSEVAGGFAPYSFHWDFGDGNTSAEAAPTHNYGSVDSYTVTLTVTDDRGNTDTRMRDDYITVLPGWNPGNIVTSAWNGLVSFVQVLGSVVIWLVIFSPVWGVVLVIFFWRRRRKKKAST
jgi:PKD repeat protein